MEKICTRCKVSKDLSEYYDKKNGKYGKHASCKACQINDNEKWRKANTKNIRMNRISYAARARTSVTKSDFKEYAQNKLKQVALALVDLAVDKGFVENPVLCDCCRKEAELRPYIEDYSAPLDAFWFCSECKPDM